MNESPFSHPIEINPLQLKYEPFKDCKRVHDFDCGEPDLNDFFNTNEIEQYEELGLGRTFNVYYGGRLVAFFTVSNDGLRCEYLDKQKMLAGVPTIKLDVLPALKIGRLAVNEADKGRGIGRCIIKYVFGLALEELSSISGVRLIIVQAKQDAQQFYGKLGFLMSPPVKRERGKNYRTMYLDLYGKYTPFLNIGK